VDLIVSILNLLFNVYYILILVRSLLPFVPHNRYHPLVSPVYGLTEPLLLPIRQGMPPMQVGFDVSPFIVILLLSLAQRLMNYYFGG
jgi:YggT family protein